MDWPPLCQVVFKYLRLLLVCCSMSTVPPVKGRSHTSQSSKHSSKSIVPLQLWSEPPCLSNGVRILLKSPTHHHGRHDSPRNCRSNSHECTHWSRLGFPYKPVNIRLRSEGSQTSASMWKTEKLFKTTCHSSFNIIKSPVHHFCPGNPPSSSEKNLISSPFLSPFSNRTWYTQEDNSRGNLPQKVLKNSKYFEAPQSPNVPSNAIHCTRQGCRAASTDLGEEMKASSASLLCFPSLCGSIHYSPSYSPDWLMLLKIQAYCSCSSLAFTI